MAKEIKEIFESYINHNEIEIILDRIKEIVDNEIIDYGEELSLSECKCLLNYITNLQKENENLKGVMFTGRNYNEVLKSEQDYKSRNKKAIEYIKQHCDRPGRLLLSKIDFNYNDLLNILQGGDE